MKKFFIVLCVLFVATYLVLILQRLGNNRYQIFMNPNVRADQYLLDTKTGRTWQLTEEIKEKYMFWHEIPRDELPIDDENSK